VALIKFGGGVTDMRGSIGGSTFARNKGGNYARARMKPCNPRSTLQSARRARMGHLAKYWSNALTEQQRDDWRAYAAGTTWTNRLGDVIEINGLAAFLRVNALVLLYSSTVIAAAPLAMGHAGGVTLSFAAESDTSKLQLAEPGGAFSKSTDGHFLLLSMGLPTEAGRLSTPPGFRYLNHTAGNSVAPPSYPLEIASAYTMAAGQRVTVSAMFQDESYRISGPHWATAIAAPSS